MSKQEQVAATLKMKLLADSGYESEVECRVSANQWGAVQNIAEGLVPALTADYSPELLEALRDLMAIVEIHQSCTKNKFAWAEMEEARAAIAKALGESQ